VVGTAWPSTTHKIPTNPNSRFGVTGTFEMINYCTPLDKVSFPNVVLWGKAGSATVTLSSLIGLRNFPITGRLEISVIDTLGAGNRCCGGCSTGWRSRSCRRGRRGENIYKKVGKTPMNY
jgi:hypothetical protein